MSNGLRREQSMQDLPMVSALAADRLREMGLEPEGFRLIQTRGDGNFLLRLSDEERVSYDGAVEAPPSAQGKTRGWAQPGFEWFIRG